MPTRSYAHFRKFDSFCQGMPYGIAVGYFNNDTNLDIAVADGGNWRSVIIRGDQIKVSVAIEIPGCKRATRRALG